MTSGTNNRTRNIVELAGAGAVLLGLVFVGLELRQNTAAVEAATLQSLTDASVNYVNILAADPELTRIWLIGASDPDSLNEIEAGQLHFLIRGQWLRFQNSFLQWKRGTLSDEDWTLYERYICRTNNNTEGFSKPLRAEHIRNRTWLEHKGVLLAPFVEFVEICWAKNNYHVN
jgi:hypothetical protein